MMRWFYPYEAGQAGMGLLFAALRSKTTSSAQRTTDQSSVAIMTRIALRRDGRQEVVPSSVAATQSHDAVRIAAAVIGILAIGLLICLRLQIAANAGL